jgi:hypothetical protein
VAGGLLGEIQVGWKAQAQREEKQWAAEAALHLLEVHGIAPTTTKTGVFCKLAAVLFNDKSTDLQHHCRAALGRAQIQDKNSPGNAARDEGDPVGTSVERKRRLVPAFRRQGRHAGFIHIGKLVMMRS